MMALRDMGEVSVVTTDVQSWRSRGPSSLALLRAVRRIHHQCVRFTLQAIGSHEPVLAQVGCTTAMEMKPFVEDESVQVRGSFACKPGAFRATLSRSGTFRQRERLQTIAGGLFCVRIT